MEAQLHESLCSALDAGEYLASRLFALPRGGKEPLIPIGNDRRIGPNFGLNAVQKRNIFALSGNRTPNYCLYFAHTIVSKLTEIFRTLPYKSAFGNSIRFSESLRSTQLQRRSYNSIGNNFQKLEYYLVVNAKGVRHQEE